MEPGISEKTGCWEGCLPFGLDWIVHDCDERHCTFPRRVVDHESTWIFRGELLMAILLAIPGALVVGGGGYGLVRPSNLVVSAPAY